jgi:hypothetical protein
VVPALDDVYAALGGRANVDLYVTSARGEGHQVLTYTHARARMNTSEKASLIVFGTGWGLAPEIIASSDGFLAPLEGAGTGYNHLSVRAACAIILDRLRGGRD